MVFVVCCGCIATRTSWPVLWSTPGRYAAPSATYTSAPEAGWKKTSGPWTGPGPPKGYTAISTRCAKRWPDGKHPGRCARNAARYDHEHPPHPGFRVALTPRAVPWPASLAAQERCEERGDAQRAVQHLEVGGGQEQARRGRQRRRLDRDVLHAYQRRLARPEGLPAPPGRRLVALRSFLRFRTRGKWLQGDLRATALSGRTPLSTCLSEGPTSRWRVVNQEGRARLRPTSQERS